MLRRSATDITNSHNSLPLHLNIKKESNMQMNNNNIGSNVCDSPLNALQKQFIMSMKTLFDLLDPQRTGYIKFADIEKDWQDDTCKGLPRGVLDSLCKVTPGNGLLSFERFCAGLKLCLIRNQKEPVHLTKSQTPPNNSGQGEFVPVGSALKKSHPPAAPMLEITNPVPNSLWNPTVRTTNTRLHSQRALSMPQLSPDSELEVPPSAATVSQPVVQHCHKSVFGSPTPPPKPPRAAQQIVTTTATKPMQAIKNNNSNKIEIRQALQNWQMNALLHEMDTHEQHKATFLMPFQCRGCADGGSSSATDSACASASANTNVTSKKSGSKRRESRRHTLQNGIDYNMLRRLKQLEEEREVLMLALNAVEKTRDWYLDQVNHVQEKIKHLGRIGTIATYGEQWSEVQQERLNLQRARVLEINRNLTALVNTWEQYNNVPMHLNLAIRAPPTVRVNGPLDSKHLGTKGNSSGIVSIGLAPPVDRLRPAVPHYNNELHFGGENRVVSLEREKQSLLRELYDLQQRAGMQPRSRTGLLSVLSQSSPVCSTSSGGLGDADVVY